MKVLKKGVPVKNLKKYIVYSCGSTPYSVFVQKTKCS
ncbi:hypothetical protein X274_07910 [Marinitoga sp. 1155]|nr:hypothetical protein X274_07910 [Marinitoga sp. 1155]